MVLQTKKLSPLNVFEDKRCYKRIPLFYEIKIHVVNSCFRTRCRKDYSGYFKDIKDYIYLNGEKKIDHKLYPQLISLVL